MAHPSAGTGHCLLCAISSDQSQHPLQESADREAGDDIAQPMREQHHPGQHQRRADTPGEIALSGRKLAGCGSKRPDMYGMAGRKRVEPPAGERHTAPVPQNGSAIGPLLIE